jgi:hypothetical protein
MYIPKPINTSDVFLPQDILALIEILAENTHENWSKQKISEGWSYGDHVDPILKLHPCIKEYHELQESDQQYDINTSMETIKVILKLGYKISK